MKHRLDAYSTPLKETATSKASATPGVVQPAGRRPLGIPLSLVKAAGLDPVFLTLKVTPPGKVNKVKKTK